MKSRAIALGLLVSTTSSAWAFHQAVLSRSYQRQPGRGKQEHGLGQQVSGRAKNTISDLSGRDISARRRHGVELHASADPSAPGKKDNKRRKVSVKAIVEQWATKSLELHRFHHKRVHVCKATTLPEVLSDFWSLAAQCAQEKYSAMAADRDYTAHVLFVVPRCDLLKDYGMMRHMDKVIDFCSGGCADFGRTVMLQHYHPEFVLPPSRHAKTPDRDGDGDDDNNSDEKQHVTTTANPSDLARVINFSRSPYPAFGLTVAGGSAMRSDPLKGSDRTGRLRLDLEVLYNSVAGCSTDDSVDAHGSEHGTIPSEPDVVEERTQKWLSMCATTAAEDGSADEVGQHYGRFLASADAFVTSGLSSPEAVISDVWSIVSELHEKAAPIVEAEKGSLSSSPSSPAATTPSTEATAAAALDGTQGGVDREGEKEQEQEEKLLPLVSTLLVAPRLHPFNCALFENFARNLAIALKQTPVMDRIEIEVYHPEFVCEGGNIDPVRRSPFPTLLIKHCGLKDELFEPSGMYKHAVPPLRLPLESAAEAATEDTDNDTDQSSPESEAATEFSTDDSHL